MPKEKRTIWDKLFKPYQKPIQNETNFQFTGGFIPSFSSFGKDPYSSDVVRSAIHAIAANAAKLKPKHIRRVNGQVIHVNGK